MCLMVIKKTTNTGKNQKFCRKVREKRVDAISSIRFFFENFSYDPLNISKPMGATSVRITG